MFPTKSRARILFLSDHKLKSFMLLTRIFENNNPINYSASFKRFIKSDDELNYSINKK